MAQQIIQKKKKIGAAKSRKRNQQQKLTNEAVNKSYENPSTPELIVKFIVTETADNPL